MRNQMQHIDKIAGIKFREEISMNINLPLEQKTLHTQLLLLGNSFRNHTHQLHNFNC